MSLWWRSNGAGRFTVVLEGVRVWGLVLVHLRLFGHNHLGIVGILGAALKYSELYTKSYEHIHFTSAVVRPVSPLALTASLLSLQSPWAQ